jgi:hypothetical protein
LLQFRNINGTTKGPVNQWGVEEMLAVLERGGLEDWGNFILPSLPPQNTSMKFEKTCMKQLN